ncbi:hypothetical protein RBK84_21900 [Pseudomonas aeruginosa]|uniref:hypothetical protein n=1 Tax=Pseudomonas aeruginosa TaxID=287 RepID=UPI000FFE4FD1|nr:hypothetical protein [Pseudomonas aeruginosa]MDQ4227054.1 hypothetical protein [Pseudomonas aeruginosa]
MDKDTFQIAFWGASLLFVICSMVITIIGWRVNSNNAKELASKKDIHDTIEKSLDALKNLEDSSYDFWLAESPETLPYQLIVLHKRLISNLAQLSELTGKPIPSVDVAALRRHATLDAETAQRPLTFSNERVMRLSRAATNIIKSDLLKKTWKS